MRRLQTLLPGSALVVLFLVFCTTNALAQNSGSQTLGDWCQAPSWAFGLPNIVTYMGIVCIIAIVSTLAAIAASRRDEQAVRQAREQYRATAVREAPVPVKKADRVLTDKAGQKWAVEEGTGHDFLIFTDGRTFTASHDGIWSRITVRSEGANYFYTDYNGNGSYICTQAGAPFGNLLKMQVTLPSGV